MIPALRRQAVPVLVLLALAGAPFLGFGSNFTLSLIARAMILGMAAVSLSLLVGGAGLVSLGHAAMVGIGAYVVGAFDLAGYSNVLIVFPAAILAAALFAFVTGAVSLRTSGVYFIMITLAFGQMAFFTTSALSVLGGDDGYTLFARTDWFGASPLDDRLTFYFVCLGLLVLVWLLCSAVLDSRFGRVLRATRENPQRAQALGFSPYPYGLAAYVLAGAISGLAGALMANATEFVSPATLSWGRSGELLFMVILGGAGRLYGAILGALAIVLLEEGLSHYLEYWRLVFGPLLVLSVIFLRDGLAGLPSLPRAAGRRRVSPWGAAPMPEPLLELRSLNKKFGGLTVTDAVSLTVLAGEIHAIIGPNGAGKTTLVSQISGTLRPDSGTVLFAGADVTGLSLQRRARLGLARSFQITSIVAGFTALENAALAVQGRSGSSFRFFRPVRDDPVLNRAAQAALDQVGLGHRAQAVAGAMSHGEKRQLELAVALATEPRLLVLDEPLAGAGPEETARLIGLLQGLKARFGILLVEHDMRAVFAMADRVSVLVYGRVVVTGTVDEIRRHPEVRSAYLGEDEMA